MLALIAGTGGLPGALVDRLAVAGEAPLVCALDGFVPELPAELQRIGFRIETFGSLLDILAERGVTRVCLAGAIRRPVLDPGAVDAATRPLIPRLIGAMEQGDDGALRTVLALIEERGFEIVGAAAIAPDLIPPEGVLTAVLPGPEVEALARIGETTLAEMGREDSGQACLVAPGGGVLREGPEGTDALLAAAAPGGILYKGPKPGQDRRVDLPVIGPETAAGTVAAGLAGLVIEAGEVLVLDRPAVVAALEAAGAFLWVRRPG